MYSFQQLFNLVTTVANQSTVNDRLVTAEDNITDIFAQIKQMKKDHSNLRDYNDSEMAKTRTQMAEEKDEQAK